MRAFAGNESPHPFIVDRVENGFVYPRGGWKFDVEYGFEVDEELGWDPRRTGQVATWLTRKIADAG